MEDGEHGFIKIEKVREDDKIEEETQKGISIEPGWQEVLISKFIVGRFINNADSPNFSSF